MGKVIEVGTWHEIEDREITRCPSYYAADSETIRTQAGDYPARVAFEGGYTVPMPYWFLVGIPAKRVEGRLYNGFGGVNYSSRELPADEDVKYVIQAYSYEIKQFVETGRLTLHPGFEWLMEAASFKHPDAPKTWEDPRFAA